MTDDIHTCSYHCDRPECIRAQRDELRDELAKLRARIEAAPVAICDSPCLNSSPNFGVRTNRSDWRGKLVRLVRVEDGE